MQASAGANRVASTVVAIEEPTPRNPGSRVVGPNLQRDRPARPLYVIGPLLHDGCGAFVGRSVQGHRIHCPKRPDTLENRPRPSRGPSSFETA